MLTKATFHLLSRTIRETREEFTCAEPEAVSGMLLTSEQRAADLALESLARNLADKLGDLNPAFDRHRFLEACHSAT